VLGKTRPPQRKAHRPQRHESELSNRRAKMTSDGSNAMRRVRNAAQIIIRKQLIDKPGTGMMRGFPNSIAEISCGLQMSLL
jgi:hypothetical protein